MTAYERQVKVCLFFVASHKYLLGTREDAEVQEEHLVCILDKRVCGHPCHGCTSCRLIAVTLVTGGAALIGCCLVRFCVVLNG